MSPVTQCDTLPSGGQLWVLLTRGRDEKNRGGQSEASLKNQLESKVSIAEAGNIVYAAYHYLCPGA